MKEIKNWQPKVLGSKGVRSDGIAESYCWQTGEKALFKSVAKNDEYSVSRLILAGADMNACNKYGMTALMVAAEHNAKDVAALLIQAGAELEAKNKDGLTALQIAAGSDSIDVVAELIKAGACVNVKTPDGETALSLSIENKAHEIMILLLAAGAQPDFTKKNEDALSSALGTGGREYDGAGDGCEKSSDGNDGSNGDETDSADDDDGGECDENLNFKILSYLPGATAKSAPTPKNLMGTLYGGHGGDCLAMETSFKKESKPTGLSDSEPGKSVRIFKNLDPFINGDVNIPIEEASVLEDYTKYKGKKLERKDKVENENMSQSYKDARLKHEYEEIRKKFSWIQAARENSLHIANLLTVAGADINEKDQYGQTALMYAVSQNLQKGVQLLLKAGADVNCKNARDETVLMRAAFKNLSDMLSLLIRNGANVNEKDISGWTALMYASKGGAEQCINILRSAGADPDARNKKGETAAQIAKKR